MRDMDTRVHVSSLQRETALLSNYILRVLDVKVIFSLNGLNFPI